MNRIIKFRGYEPQIKDWIYGGISIFDNGATIFDDNDVVNTAYEVDINSIGQFTGLFDKNGVEIFEGDILLLVKRNYLVVWNDGAFYIQTGKIKTRLSRVILDTYSIIGNVFENPELLHE